ncbi:unnamed protein product [Polarella glacialis]|uniref:Uncharacterized protein n=1 Tax=Polarella glacialis TaxID=89957 RepID=A0A813GAQ4_POLGL|nr:unnamed protein product [Polarella glacialis]
MLLLFLPSHARASNTTDHNDDLSKPPAIQCAVPWELLTSCPQQPQAASVFDAASATIAIKPWASFDDLKIDHRAEKTVADGNNKAVLISVVAVCVCDAYAQHGCITRVWQSSNVRGNGLHQIRLYS